MRPDNASEIQVAVASGRTSARKIATSSLRRIEELDASLHCFLTVDPDLALAEADRTDQQIAAGEPIGPLAGVPFSVKDLYDTAGLRTTYGSRVFTDHVPTQDAEIVHRMRAAGAVLVGKTNTPEFAIYIRTTNDLMPETINPWDLSRSCGGSSGGAASSVAAGMTPVALASDGGGSTRIPAALCGVVGIFPSRGAVPRGGGRVSTRRFSSAGPIAVQAHDAKLVLSVIRGPSPSDPLSRGLYPTGVPSGQWPAAKPRIRWVGDSGRQANTTVVNAIHRAALSLAETTGTPLWDTDDSFETPRFSEAFYDIMQADRYSTGGELLHTDPASNALLTSYTRHHFDAAAKVSGSNYSRALEMQLEATDKLLSLFDDVDVVACPTVGEVAPALSQPVDALPEDARRAFVAFTFLCNLTGFPAATVPCGLVEGLPIGLQLIGRPGSDDQLLDLCAIFQERVMTMPRPPLSGGSTGAVREGSV